MSPSYADQFVKVDGQELHFQEWMSPAGAPTLLMVHGVTSQSHTFDAVAATFASRYRCIAMDLRGHGDSQWNSDGNYDYSDYASDVLGLLNALHLDKVHYIGTSLGGRVGMTVAANEPRRFASAVFNDISPNPCPAGLARIVAAYTGGPRPFASVDAFVDQVLGVYAPRIKALPKDAAAAIARWFVREADGGFLPKFDGRALQRLVALDKLPDQSEMLWRGLRGLNCPLLLLRAEKSDILAQDAARAMQAALPQARLVEIPRATHPPALIEPEAQIALEAFLGG